MNFDRFKEIDKEILEILGLALDKVRMKSMSDFTLLLARGDFYEVIYTHAHDLSPYVIEDPTDELVDDTRISFLNQFMKRYIERLRSGSIINDKELEYDINIQLMVYTHVWESHWLLKQLERIASILSGKGYVWKSCVDSCSKSNFIKDHILKQLEGHSNLYDLIGRIYSDTLRNDFAHSSYYIDMDESAIKSRKHGLLEENVIPFDEWEDIFVHSFLLSADLNNLLFDIKHKYIELFGNEPIICKWPSRDNPKHYYDRSIIPAKDRANPEYIRFDFIR